MAIANIRRCQRRSVVDAITDLGDDLSLALQLTDDALLVLRQQLRRGSMPGPLAMASAVRRLSPVSMTGVMPMALSA
jgi:hypothetical protein